ncbi:MAG: hypothetical protein RL693_2781 [Verrucomicrobiota bacterium]|jgi:rhodanese-related sulfurtransferase
MLSLAVFRRFRKIRLQSQLPNPTRFRKLAGMNIFLLSILVLMVVSAGWYWFEGRWDRRLFVSAPGINFKNLRPRAAMELLNAKNDVQVLDVRSKLEFNWGCVPDALNIPLGDPDFRERVAALNISSPVLVYCAGGYRSRKAVAILRELHFKAVYHLHRGYHSWQIAGQPVMKPVPDN